jgi:Tfp pilus assembly protein PilZ
MPKPLSQPSSGVGPPEDVLRKIRVAYVQKAQLVHEKWAREVFIVDLGLIGVFIELAEPLAVGDHAELRFPLPGNDIPVVAGCRVAWWHAAGQEPRDFPPGVGLTFVDISESDRARLRAVLLEHCRRPTRDRRFTRPWPWGDAVD